MRISHKKNKFQSGVTGRLMLVLSCVLCLVYGISAQTAAELYKTAATQYKANQFDQAAAAYEKIIMQGYRNPEVYYNLGNCYFKLKNTGKAILNFERAHRLAPEDEDIVHNLKLAEFRAVDKLTPVPQLGIVKSWHDLLTSQTPKGWGVFALACVWAALLFFALYLFAFRKGLIMFSGVLLLFLSFSFVYLALKQTKAEENSDQAILMIENVNVKSAPDVNGTDLFTIHEGLKLEICDQVGNWTKIRLTDGKVGWLEKNMFEKI
jgi:tetratricopeptide (TPR) repeat protein